VGLSKSNKKACPCKGCEHNLNAGDRVRLDDHDTEIGCKAKQRRGNKVLVPVKPTEMTETGCSYRRRMVVHRENVFA
jgi:hypothetical protein